MSQKLSQITGPDGEPAATESEWHCSAEWHMVQMKSRLAAPIYTWARKVSNNSGSFHASARHMATYFNINPKTILCALKELTDKGFLKLNLRERGKPNAYSVVDHREWVIDHPGRCVQKIKLPWTGDGDPLGRQLYAISGGRVKFWPRQMTGLRNLGFSDQDIIKQFRGFLAKWEYIGSAWDRVYFDFHRELKTLATSSDVTSRTVHPDNKVHQSNGAQCTSRTDSILPKDSPKVKRESTIPAKAAALRPPSTFDSDAKPSEEVSQIIGLTPTPSPPPSEEEFERRKRDQKEALARHLAGKVHSA